MHMTAINWFEIPVTNLERAARFYETVLATTLKREVFFGVPHAVFATDGRSTGALIFDPKRKPSGDGTVLYLAANHRLDECAARVAGAGGKMIVPRTELGGAGAFVILEDTEGNQVGLHTI
jgi:predicted enzyme related to lactoylglutathione lyase